MDRGMMERWGITPEEFSQAIARHNTDAAMLRWVQSKVSDAHTDAANSWLSTEKFTSLNRQDREENAFD
jgi:Domain of unknown function (DUF5069)